MAGRNGDESTREINRIRPSDSGKNVQCIKLRSHRGLASRRSAAQRRSAAPRVVPRDVKRLLMFGKYRQENDWWLHTLHDCCCCPLPLFHSLLQKLKNEDKLFEGKDAKGVSGHRTFYNFTLNRRSFSHQLPQELRLYAHEFSRCFRISFKHFDHCRHWLDHTGIILLDKNYLISFSASHRNFLCKFDHVQTPPLDIRHCPLGQWRLHRVSWRRLFYGADVCGAFVETRQL